MKIRITVEPHPIITITLLASLNREKSVPARPDPFRGPDRAQIKSLSMLRAIGQLGIQISVRQVRFGGARAQGRRDTKPGVGQTRRAFKEVANQTYASGSFLAQAIGRAGILIWEHDGWTEAVHLRDDGRGLSLRPHGSL